MKLFAVSVLSLIVFGFCIQAYESAVSPNQAHFIPECKYVNGHGLLQLAECRSSINEQTLNPMDKLFQIIFILFFISPPLIVILLFLIWRELKERNKLK